MKKLLVVFTLMACSVIPGQYREPRYFIKASHMGVFNIAVTCLDPTIKPVGAYYPGGTLVISCAPPEKTEK